MPVPDTLAVVNRNAVSAIARSHPAACMHTTSSTAVPSPWYRTPGAHAAAALRVLGDWVKASLVIMCHTMLTVKPCALGSRAASRQAVISATLSCFLRSDAKDRFLEERKVLTFRGSDKHHVCCHREQEPMPQQYGPR